MIRPNCRFSLRMTVLFALLTPCLCGGRGGENAGARSIGYTLIFLFL